MFLNFFKVYPLFYYIHIFYSYDRMPQEADSVTKHFDDILRVCRRVWFVAKVSVFFVLFSCHCAKCVTDSLTCVCHWNTEVPLRDT